MRGHTGLFGSVGIRTLRTVARLSSSHHLKCIDNRNKAFQVVYRHASSSRSIRGRNAPTTP